jgi:hypothetical protein
VTLGEAYDNDLAPAVEETRGGRADPSHCLCKIRKKGAWICVEGGQSSLTEQEKPT